MKNLTLAEKSNRRIILTGKHLSVEDDCACPDGAIILKFDHTSKTENDCACPNDTTLAHLKSPTGMSYVQTPQTHSDVLLHEFHLAFSPYASAGPSVLNLEAWERWQSFAEPHPLEEAVDHSLAQENLIRPVSGQFSLHASRPETLNAWLHITNACNLDCPYCYVRKSPASMSEPIGLEAITKIFHTAQKHQFKGVKIKYSGGEATLRFGLIKKLSARARSLSEESSIKLDQVILSNGTFLRPQDATWLIENNLRVMISLDGIGQIQDKMRPLQNGSATFHKVATTIDDVLLPRGLAPSICVTITRHNASHVAETVRWALSRDLPISLNFYRRPPSTIPQDDLAFEDQTIVQGMMAAYRVFEELLPTRPFLNGLLDRVQINSHTHTCGVGINYIVITHEGKLVQCQMQLDRPVSESLQDDLLSLIAEGNIRNVSVEEKMTCKDCLYRFRCTGGCPLETQCASNRGDLPGPNCQTYQALFPAALRLEGLRLLKCNGYLQ